MPFQSFYFVLVFKDQNLIYLVCVIRFITLFHVALQYAIYIYIFMFSSKHTIPFLVLFLSSFLFCFFIVFIYYCSLLLTSFISFLQFCFINIIKNIQFFKYGLLFFHTITFLKTLVITTSHTFLFIFSYIKISSINNSFL